MYDKQVLAFDIGGTSAKYAYISHKGEVTNKSKFSTNTITDVNQFFGAMRMVIEEGINQGIEKVGISSLGIFDETGLCLGGVENLPFLEQVNIVEQVTTWFPALECHITNDGMAAAMGEYWLGEGQGCNNFICITLGTGIGGAIVINGMPLLGSHFQSGEIGYTNYQSDEEYLEMRYSTKKIMAEAARRMNVEKIGGIAFVEKVKEGDKICEELFQEWMDVLAQMMANSILLIDPEKIIIGGGVSGEKDWLCNALDEKLQLHLPETFRGKTIIRVAKHGNDAGLLGAVEGYFRR